MSKSIFKSAIGVLSCSTALVGIPVLFAAQVYANELTMPSLYSATPYTLNTYSAAPVSGAQLPLYYNADGTRTDDEAAAAESWRTPEFLKDHALSDVHAEDAYADGITGKDVIIGEVDSGIFGSHPQLQGQTTSLDVTGTYGADGWRYEDQTSHNATWQAGDAFDNPGDYNPLINDSHGTAAAGEMVAKRDGLELHGIAFDAHLLVANSGGTDGSIFGPNVDYNYFKEAYGVLARNGARVINSSWGQEYSKAGDYGTIAGLSALYDSFGGKKTFLDAAAEVSQQYGTIQVWANGNEGRDNPRAVASLPYFRPETEQYWIAVTGVTVDDQTIYDRCGVTKYWCMAGPTVDIYSTSVGDSQGAVYDRGNWDRDLTLYPPSPEYTPTYNGTSASAPNVTASLALVMERFPYLSGPDARNVLLTTATHLTNDSVVDDNPDVPNAVFGWGKPNLNMAMNGPGQFLSRVDANLAAGATDIWSNNISTVALAQRETEDKAEIAAAAAQLALYGEEGPPSIDLQPEIDAAPILLQALSDAFAANDDYATAADYIAALAAVEANPVAAAAYNSTSAPALSTIPGFSGTMMAMVLGFSLPSLDYNAIAATFEKAPQEMFRTGQLRAALLSASTYDGGLTKSGDGRLILTGANTYAGDTIVNGGLLQIGNGGTAGSITSNAVVNQDGTLAFNRSDASTYAGNISGTGLVATLGGVGGTGALTLSGSNSYSGPTYVGGGALLAGSSGGFSPSSFFIVNPGSTLDLNGFDETVGSLAGAGTLALGVNRLTAGGDNTSTDFAGAITGTGGLTKAGTGTMTLTSEAANTGDTIVDGGRFQIGDGGTTGSLASNVVVNKDGTLAFDRSDLAAYVGNISGAGGVATLGGAQGTGTLALAGASTYTGPTTVDGGTLVIDGSITSDATVNAGGRMKVSAGARSGGIALNGGEVLVDGTSGDAIVNAGGILGGNGIVGGLMVSSGGVVAPGQAGGTLATAKDATFNPGSGLVIGVGPDGSAGKLVVGGTAMLLGGVVTVTPQNGGAPLTPRETLALLNTDVTILAASGGVNGAFDAVVPQYSFIGAALTYNPNDVALSLARNDVAFADLADTRNGKAAASAIDASGVGNTLFDTVVTTTATESLPSDFASLSGEVHASIKGALLDDGRFVRDAVENRVRAAFGDRTVRDAANGSAPIAAVWGESYGSWSHADSNGNAASDSRSIGGLVTGFDGMVADTWRFGLLAGYGNTSLDSGSGSASADSYQLGLYGGTEIDALTLTFGTNFAHHDIDTHRNAHLLGTVETERASYGADSAQVFGEAGYRIDTPYAALLPFANAAYAHVKTDGFSENGGDFALSGGAGSDDLTTTTLGLRISQSFALSDTAYLTARAMAGWTHAFGDATPGAALAFAGGSAFDVEGLPIAKDTARLEAGLDLDIGKLTTLGVSYSGQFSSQARDNAVKADLTVKF